MKACANEPKPPRVTLPEPASDDATPFDEPPGKESPLKKLERDDDPDDPWPPDEEEPRGEHPALEGAAIPGWLGAQFSPGISA